MLVLFPDLILQGVDGVTDPAIRALQTHNVLQAWGHEYISKHGLRPMAEEQINGPRRAPRGMGAL